MKGSRAGGLFQTRASLLVEYNDILCQELEPPKQVTVCVKAPALQFVGLGIVKYVLAAVEEIQLQDLEILSHQTPAISTKRQTLVTCRPQP